MRLYGLTADLHPEGCTYVPAVFFLHMLLPSLCCLFPQFSRQRHLSAAYHTEVPVREFHTALSHTLGALLSE